MPVEGDPHITTIQGEEFDFQGEPGEVYNLLTAHELAWHCTVKDIGEGRQIVDRSIVHLPNETDVIVHTNRVEIRTKYHHIVIYQDPGHTQHEGKVFPDPLIGVPHLDCGHTHECSLEDATGILVDGGTNHKIGVKWPYESE